MSAQRHPSQRSSLLTVPQAAELLRVPEAVVQGWVDQDSISCVHMNDGSALMPLSAVQDAIVTKGPL